MSRVDEAKEEFIDEAMEARDGAALGVLGLIGSGMIIADTWKKLPEGHKRAIKRRLRKLNKGTQDLLIGAAEGARSLSSSARKRIAEEMKRVGM